MMSHPRCGLGHAGEGLGAHHRQHGEVRVAHRRGEARRLHLGDDAAGLDDHEVQRHVDAALDTFLASVQAAD
jgi:hypothetical protein